MKWNLVPNWKLWSEKEWRDIGIIVLEQCKSVDPTYLDFFCSSKQFFWCNQSTNSINNSFGLTIFWFAYLSKFGMNFSNNDFFFGKFAHAMVDINHSSLVNLNKQKKNYMSVHVDKCSRLELRTLVGIENTCVILSKR